MKRIFTLFVCCGSSLLSVAQQHSVYAIAAEEPGSVVFSSINRTDLRKGKISEKIFSASQSFEARTTGSKRSFTAASVFRGNDSAMHPFPAVIGAAAYDAANERLFYVATGIDQLRYMDLRAKTPSFTYIDDQAFGTAKSNGIAGSISRLVITKGCGYALTNDGDHLFRFNTKGDIRIEDLGAVKDNPNDTLNGYHKNCTCMSYGGDMVADANGDLYVITPTNRIHKIELKTMVITYIGTISGLPQGFTTNGAAVNEKGQLIVASAVSMNNTAFPYHTVNMQSLQATALEGEFMSSSDLASSHVLPVKRDVQAAVVNAAAFVFSDVQVANEKVSVNPNPVTGGRIRMVLNQLEKGDHTAVLFDLQGKAVTQKRFTVSSKQQVEEMYAPTAQGQYMLMIVDRGKKTVFNKALLIAQ